MEENTIDIVALIKQLWVKRKFILKCLVAGTIVGVVVAFSIPREYATTVVLAPESNNSSSLGNASALASMAGINLGANSTDGDIAPELYPTIVESSPFILGLFKLKVKDKNDEINTDLFTYINEYQKSPWWSKIIKLPGTIIGLFYTKDAETGTDSINQSSLTQRQTDVYNNLAKRISLTVDKKTGIITITSMMQNATISAAIADTLTTYLQSYIISYRTQKARQDLAFTESLYAEAKKNYYDAQQKYASFLDGNQNIVLASYRLHQEKLQNETNLAYNVYNQVAQQLQLARVKVQDTTPIYTVIQPSITPLIPTNPNKKLVIISFILLALLTSSLWIVTEKYRLSLKEIFSK